MHVKYFHNKYIKPFMNRTRIFYIMNLKNYIRGAAKIYSYVKFNNKKIRSIEFFFYINSVINSVLDKPKEKTITYPLGLSK